MGTQTHLPYWALVEDLVFVASLHALQGHVLAEASVDAEGQGQALLEPQPLLEAPGRRVDVQQVLGAVVVGQGHAAHQPATAETGNTNITHKAKLPGHLLGTASFNALDGYETELKSVAMISSEKSLP